MTEKQIDKFLAIQQAQLAMMMGIYHNLQILCQQQGKEPGAFDWRDVHTLIETGKSEVAEI